MTAAMGGMLLNIACDLDPAMGGMLLNIAHDLDHEAKINDVIFYLNEKIRCRANPEDFFNEAISKAGLKYSDLSEDDFDRIKKNLHY